MQQPEDKYWPSADELARTAALDPLPSQPNGAFTDTKLSN